VRIVALQNDPDVPIGRFAAIAAAGGHTVDLVCLYDGQPLPNAADFDAVVVLGGEMGAYEIDRCPYLSSEKEFLAEQVAAGVPVLGLCLGGQLLADALGGRAYLADEPEAALTTLTKRVQGDRLADILTSGPIVLFHRDTLDAPPGATVLAGSERYTYVFRFGSAVGVQPHPELTQETFGEWVDHPGSIDILKTAGVSPVELKAAAASAEPAIAALAASFFNAWLEEAETLRMRA